MTVIHVVVALFLLGSPSPRTARSRHLASIHHRGHPKKPRSITGRHHRRRTRATTARSNRRTHQGTRATGRLHRSHARHVKLARTQRHRNRHTVIHRGTARHKNPRYTTVHHRAVRRSGTRHKGSRTRARAQATRHQAQRRHQRRNSHPDEKAMRLHKKRRKASRKRVSMTYPPMPVYNIHSHELIALHLYDPKGRIRPQALAAFTHLLRSHRTGESLPIHWRLAVLIYQAWIHFGQPQVTIFSGYRPRQFCAMKGSKHITGHAVDFSLDGISNKELVHYFLAHAYKIGVGYYPNSYHIHLDVRPKNGFWVDYSSPGEPAIYSRNARHDFRTGWAKEGRLPRWAKRRHRRWAGKQGSTGTRTPKSRNTVGEGILPTRPVGHSAVRNSSPKAHREESATKASISAAAKAPKGKPSPVATRRPAHAPDSTSAKRTSKPDNRAAPVRATKHTSAPRHSKRAPSKQTLPRPAHNQPRQPASLPAPAAP